MSLQIALSHFCSRLLFVVCVITICVDSQMRRIRFLHLRTFLFSLVLNYVTILLIYLDTLHAFITTTFRVFIYSPRYCFSRGLYTFQYVKDFGLGTLPYLMPYYKYFCKYCHSFFTLLFIYCLFSPISPFLNII